MYMSGLTAEIGLIHGSGFEVVDNRLTLSPGSRLNAERGAELLSTKAIERVICSGRGPVYGVDYQSSEAQLTADHLISLGIHHQQIEVESSSTSAVGNWAKSAPIVLELGATSVMGISGKVTKHRMHMIGDFVADKSGFELVGYSPSEIKGRPKDYARELIMGGATWLFLTINPETPIDSLEEAYQEYKGYLGLAKIKKIVHRGTATPTDG
jgi:DUF218 domain